MRARSTGWLWRTCRGLALGFLMLVGLVIVVAPAQAQWLQEQRQDRLPDDGPTQQAQPQSECTVADPQMVTEVAPAFETLQIEEAWRYAEGEGVVVAVIDSGVAGANDHFTGALRQGVNLLDDGSPADEDTFGHGTAAASIIAARPVTGSTVVGIAPRATIQPVRIYYADTEEAEDDDEHITPQRIADGIRWAAENGADVINVSLNTTEDHPDLAAAVATAAEHGALVVASSGNRNTSDIEENVLRYPAAYEGVLAVSPVDTTGRWWAEAAYESDIVDVAAPGQHVPTAFFDAGDCILQPFEAPPSTSWATAHVSGVAALIASRYPEEDAQQWAYRLQVTASRASTGASDGQIGWGIIDPLQALQFVDDGTAPGPESPTQEGAESANSTTPDQGRTVSDDPMGPAPQDTRWWLLGALGVGVLAVGLVRLRRSRRTAG